MVPEVLLAHYDVDVAHTRHVANLSLAIFDTVQKKCDLPTKARYLLEIGALLHDIGLTTDPANHNIVGRDIILSTELDGLDEDQRAIVACMVAFHRKKVRPETEPAYLRLGKKNRHLALCLAALLRVADGLDYSHTQTTIINECIIQSDHITLVVVGSHSEGNCARASKKADLWHKILPYPLNVVHGTQATEEVSATTTAMTDSLQPPTIDTPSEAATGNTIPLDAALPPGEVKASDTSPPQTHHNDTLAEVGRRLLRRHMQRLLREELGARADKDIEAVHEMRVATRRMRAILPLLEAIAPQKTANTFRKRIKTIAQDLAGVRDCDVFLQQVQGYRAALPETDRPALEILTTAIQREREVARAHMLIDLDSQRYATFKRDFAAFITDNASGWNRTTRICDRAGSTIWQRYEELRVYETSIALDMETLSNLPEEQDVILHNMRIAGKRLRYVLEIFSEQAGDKATIALAPLVELQDCLGLIQDVAVAKAFVANLEADNEEEQAALAAYVASREADRKHQLALLPKLWQTMTSKTYRRKLMDVIIAL
jgi:CHAD domain-containing protein